ncbi:MAG: Rieske 2Fe-2S domain-containing protein [Actinomycetia bacterium]|nr:Rieske 2Fe-2S domain-containing protein [Actinomycetes bacterium]
MIPAYAYSDDDVFALERDRVFTNTWVFLAHESEIPEPGDFVLRRIVDNSLIVGRDDSGQVRVHFNMCLHRGMQVCRAEKGTTSHFHCPYHAWSYGNDGALSGLPFHGDAFGGEDGLRRDDHRLVAPAHVDSYNGLIFANLDPGAEPLLDHLGDFRFYLDLYTQQSRSGIELMGPQRWRVNANWKIGCEDFVGDMYHTPFTHKSVVKISLFREPKANKRKEGVLYFAGRGGGTTYKLPPGGFDDRMRYVGYPDEMIDRMRSVWSAEQHQLVHDDGFMVSAATLFPNLSLVHNWPQIRETDAGDSGEGEVVPFISLRQWQPISATETEVLSWFAVDAEAPDDFKRDSYKAYLMCFGTSGMFEQDDIENWVSITTASQGTMARDLLLNSRMGLNHDDSMVGEPLPEFAGPGFARVGYGEFNQRNWLALWSSHLTGGPVQSVHPLHPGAQA